MLYLKTGGPPKVCGALFVKRSAFARRFIIILLFYALSSADRVEQSSMLHVYMYSSGSYIRRSATWRESYIRRSATWRESYIRRSAT